MPFGVVSGVSRGMGVLDGVVFVKGEGAVLHGGEVGRPIVTNGAFATRLFSNYSEDLLFRYYSVAQIALATCQLSSSH